MHCKRRRTSPLEDAKFHITAGTDKGGLDVKYIDPFKGRGVFSTISFGKGDFVVEYRGELISQQVCENRQKRYHDAFKVFMFEFRFNGKLWCVDAAVEDGSLGRLVNDDHINPNTKMKNIKVDGKPHLCLFAIRNISAGEEITYNYGDTDWPWRGKEVPAQPSAGLTVSDSREGSQGECSAALVSVMNTECGQNLDPSQSPIGPTSNEEKMTTESCQNQTTASKADPVNTVAKCQKHHLVCATVSCLDKCVQCIGPVSSLKWLGYKCTVCSGIWHKSCFKKCINDEPKHPSQESDSASSEIELLSDKQENASDEEYIPDTEPESDGSEACREAETDQASEKHVERLGESELDPPLEENSVEFAASSNAPVPPNAEATSQETPEIRAEEDVQAPTSLISKNYCFICGKAQSKIARHLKTHKMHPEIEHAFSFPERSVERRRLLEKLRNKGNFQHNNDVLMKATGSLKVRRKPRILSKDISGKFIHCMYCKGLFVRKELWRHVRRCHSQPKMTNEVPGRAKVLGLATHAESAYSQQISSGVWKLLGSMKQDEIALAVRNDFCIIQLAQSLYNKHGHDPTKYEYIRQKLREVGRFLLVLRKESSIHSTEEAVKPANFQRVVQAVKKVSGYDEEKHCYHTPSLALKLGHTLQKICDIIHCRALITEDDELMKSTEMFKKLYSCKWSELVSHTALNTLNSAKYNKPLTLPFTEDVKLLHKHLENSASNAVCSLKETATPQSYAELAKITLAQIIVFNRRRAGEVSKMQLQSFHARNQTELHQDVAMALSQTEQKLCNYFSRIEITGKRGRKVAVLLTPSMVDALSLLVSKRTECSVCDTNVFLFARPKSMSFYRGQDCLRVHASQCGATHPEHLRSTQLRKHVATLSQVLNLKNNELDQLADFLGHDVRVHRDFYRLPVPTTQLAKISKLLLAMEKGKLSSVQGKSLDEIDIDGEIDSDSDAVESDESEDDMPAAAQSEICDPVAGLAESEIDHAFSESADVGKDLVSTSNIDESGTTSEGRSVGKDSDGSKRKKQPWSKTEISAVMKHFKNHIKEGKLATKNECSQCRLAERPVLDGRTDQNIRDFVRNRGVTFKRQSEKIV